MSILFGHFFHFVIAAIFFALVQPGILHQKKKRQAGNRFTISCLPLFLSLYKISIP
jgi:branched-subunit amino acid transport protein